jgi:hypothetical protein
MQRTGIGQKPRLSGPKPMASLYKGFEGVICDRRRLHSSGNLEMEPLKFNADLFLPPTGLGDSTQFS